MLAAQQHHEHELGLLSDALKAMGQVLLPQLGTTPLAAAEASTPDVQELVSVLAMLADRPTPKAHFDGNSKAVVAEHGHSYGEEGKNIDPWADWQDPWSKKGKFKGKDKIKGKGRINLALSEYGLSQMNPHAHEFVMPAPSRETCEAATNTEAADAVLALVEASEEPPSDKSAEEVREEERVAAVQGKVQLMHWADCPLHTGECKCASRLLEGLKSILNKIGESEESEDEDERECWAG